MVKAILKKIFPRIFLKELFLVFNKIKINTIDRILFPEKIIPDEKFLIKEESNPFLEKKVSISSFPVEAQKKLKLWIDPAWRQDQYFLHFKESALLEPYMGWAVTSRHQLIYPSLGFSRASYVHKPNFIESYIRKNNVKYLSKIISLRDTGEENYFHFYNDVLAKLFFIQDHSFDISEFTIVISERLFAKEFFQFFYKNTWIKNLNWHVQNKEWISFEEAIFCKPYTHTKKYLEMAVNLVLPKSSINKTRKIFLTRSKNSLRYIENIDEIKDVLEAYQFETVDTANLKVAQQIELFSECQYLISIHGAGLTNIIFRQGNPLSILEIIQPSDYIPFHYIMLAHQYNYKYNMMLGETGVLRHQGGFRVNPIQLKEMLGAMLK